MVDKIKQAIKYIKHIDEELLIELAKALSNASNKYFYQRRIVGEYTIKLILYKNVLGECDWIKRISRCFYTVDNVKIDPFDRKLSKRNIDNNMFTPYIDNEEEDRIREIYNDCLKEGYPKIKNFKKDFSKYVRQLKNIYKSYVNEIVPMLGNEKTYSLKEYEKVVRKIFK